SPLMTPAQDSLWAALDALEIKPPRCPVYANVTASPTSNPAEIRQLLKEQLLAPVLWMQSIQAMIRYGGKIFLEIGPGNVLTGLIKRIDRNVNCIPVGTVESLESALTALRIV
ncbi:MAG: [acyl-carrier-protein] S-malonyltransferase, partial [bacterium]